jgi:S1-C subfamily serine protease
MAGSLRCRTPRAAIYVLAAVAVLLNASVIPYAIGDTATRPKRAATPLPVLPPLPPVLRRNNPAWFGIETRTLTPERARRLHIPAYVNGVEIIAIAKDSPAARLPLSIGTRRRPGNLILSVDDEPASSPAMLRGLLERHRPGEQALLVLIQPEQLDQSINVSVTLDGRPAGADRFQ